jgi:nucleotide-binding universal stress UspA family protein
LEEIRYDAPQRPTKEAAMDTRIRTIVVGVAAMHEQHPRVAPAGEDPVLASAVRLAEQLGAQLHVVQCIEVPDPVRSAYTHAVYGDTSANRRQLDAEHHLQELVERCGYDRIRCHVVEGSPSRRLCHLATEFGADLLIVGATRRGWLWSNILGSTAEHVLRRAAVPVLVLRRPRGKGEASHRVLMTTDLSAVSSAVIETGLGLVESLFGAQPVEFRSLLTSGYANTMLRHIPPETMVADVRRRHARFLEHVDSHGHRLVPRLRWGNASTEIVREAGEWHADLVVLGTHSRLGTSRWLLGSTAAAVLRGLSCDALVIPARVATARRTASAGVEPFAGAEERSPSKVHPLVEA